MSLNRRTFRTLAMSAALVLTIAVGARAQSNGLVRVVDSPTIYWVDPFGIRHHVPDSATLKYFFEDTSARQISGEEMLRMPVGQTLALGAPPQAFVGARDPQAAYEGAPQVNPGYVPMPVPQANQGYVPVGSPAVRSPAIVEDLRPGWNTGPAYYYGRERHERRGSQGFLVRARGSREVYFVDRTGTRHRVRSREQREFFGDAPVNSVRYEELESMPLGPSIGRNAPPQYFDTERHHEDWRRR